MITQYAFAESVAREHYEEDVYAHVSTLAAVEFSRSGSQAQFGRFRLSMEKYESLGQAAFEEADRLERRQALQVDWNEVDAEADAFESLLTQSLPASRTDEEAHRLIEFSVQSFEHWLVYQRRYPDSLINPWGPTRRILERGRLLLFARLNGAEASGALGTSGIQAIIKGASQRVGRMPIDGRYELQARVLAFLKEHAQGHENPISLDAIRAHLRESGVSLEEDELQITVTVPLKKAAVIGSTGQGHFFIRSHEDLVQAYCFHLTKVRSSATIMERYQLREADFGGEDLKTACERGILNRLR